MSYDSVDSVQGREHHDASHDPAIDKNRKKSHKAPAVPTAAYVCNYLVRDMSAELGQSR